MTETIQVAIISASLSALVNCTFQIINKLIDLKKASTDKKEEEARLYKEKKEQVYIAALDRLLQIRRGFDYISDDPTRNKQLKKMIDNQNQIFIEISPKLRLYAPDNIFNQYQFLTSFKKFAYAPLHGPRLVEDSKRAYDTQITLLAHRMQEDLGYRKYSNAHDTIQCPDCGTIHDIVSNCPTCGMTYEQLQIWAHEILTQETSQNSEVLNKEPLKNHSRT